MQGRIIILISISLSFYLGSCTTGYYQLLDTSSNDIQIVGSEYFYENENLSIKYNLWQNNGNGSFLITNKTDTDLIIDLTASHFVINGYANTYYQNIIRSEGRSAISTRQSRNNNSLSLESGVSATEIPEKEVVIPSFASKRIGRFNLKNSLYRNCDVALYPNNRQIKTLKFTEETTPWKGRNIISYSFVGDIEVNRIENIFWISEITNYPKEEFVNREFLEECGEIDPMKSDIYIHSAPNRFYIRYGRN